jgi:hypothetical protein
MSAERRRESLGKNKSLGDDHAHTMPKEFGNQSQQIVQQEATPQTSPERQPLPSVLDILERRAQLRESWVRFRRSHKHQHTREYLALRNEHLEKVEQLGDEVASLYPTWPARDRLTFDLYTTVEEWRYGLPAQQTQQFIAKVQPLSDEGLAEELRTARAAAERKAAIAKKISETQRRNRNLTPQVQGVVAMCEDFVRRQG